ncbi:beta-galactosidase [Vigna unguiculata]|uniref:Beta-galactosidase n=1 Tax=Vigna unguiculata TaxID=3917 RepID=A0A4D6N5I8_VIGUN|nr:beta-galactosidase [Vigna unguiculata]
MRIRSKKSSGAASKLVAMAKRSSKATIFFIFVSFMLFCAFLPVFAPLPSFHSHSPHRSHRNTVSFCTPSLSLSLSLSLILLFSAAQYSQLVTQLHELALWQMVNRKFEIASDRFWRDGEPFQIIGGDVHYFRVHPEVVHFFLTSLSLERGRGIFSNSLAEHPLHIMIVFQSMEMLLLLPL